MGIENDVKIFVCGSCHFSDPMDDNRMQGTGGYGVVINVNGNRIEEFSRGYADTTNARMDILGITEGLKRINQPGNVTVYLSNGNIIDTLTKGWLENWKKVGFGNRKHADLWLELDKVISSNLNKLSFKHSREVKYHPDFLLAEHLGRTMSGKKSLQSDLQAHGQQSVESLGNSIELKELIFIENDKPILNSICVDASCIGNPGPMEYRGLETASGKEIFSMKYQEATNNIGEFLGIVHALALFKRDKMDVEIIYSDSLNAISWVKQKKCKTKFVQTNNNFRVFEHIERALNWLDNNQFETKILKWNTFSWGQIPADYGRK